MKNTITLNTLKAAAEALEAAGPWGQGFPEPVFDGRFDVRETRILAEKHLKMTVVPEGANVPLEAIAFNADLDVPLQPGGTVRLVYRLGVNDFREVRRLQLVVEALELA